MTFNQQFMKTRNTLLIIICLIALGSCKNKNEAYMEKMVSTKFMQSSSPPPPPPPAAAKTQELYSQKLVKKGELTISSKDIELTKTLIYRFVKECNGYVTNENLVKNDVFSYIEISLNIQASHFDNFLLLLDSSKMNIVSRTFSVEDISLKYIDDSTRLQNKKKLEKKYLDLLSKTNDIKNLLEIEDKLEEIQTDIEVKESQLKLLDKKITYSEFTIRIEKSISNLTYEDSTKFRYKLSKGIIQGWEGIKSVLVFLITIWPLYVLITIIFLVIRKIKKRKNKK
jgi:hypothetical protein